MKKIIIPLLLLLAVTGCREEPKENLIDESILGKWKVEYSKMLRPADYNKETGEITTYENTQVREYFGDYDEENYSPILNPGLFHSEEYKINIMANNYVDVYIAKYDEYDTDTLRHFYYKIKDGYILKKNDQDDPDEWISDIIKYRIENDSLILENIEQPWATNQSYTISQYSRIKD